MDTQTDPQQVTDGVPEGTAPAPITAVETPPATVGNGKNVVIPSQAFKARLNAATDRGKKAALSEFETQAKALGYASVTEMFEAAKKARQTPAPAPQAAKPPQPTRQEREPKHMPENHDRSKEALRAQRRAEQESQRFDAERKARIRAERQRRDAERARQDNEVKHSMQLAVMQNGVTDVDFGTYLLDQYVSGKSPEELEKFDEKKWFEELRTSRPYLFGEVVRPATTGTGPGNPPAPRPSAALSTAATANGVDVKKMNPVQFRDYLAKKGLSLDHGGD